MNPEHTSPEYVRTLKVVEINPDITKTMAGDAKHFADVYLPLIAAGAQTKIGRKAWRQLEKSLSSIYLLAFLEPKYYEQLSQDPRATAQERDILVKIPTLLNLMKDDLKNLSRVLSDPDQYASLKETGQAIVKGWDNYAQTLSAFISRTTTDTEARTEAA